MIPDVECVFMEVRHVSGNFNLAEHRMNHNVLVSSLE